MVVRNRTELDAEILSIANLNFPDNNSGLITPLDVRNAFVDGLGAVVDSLTDFASVLSGGPVSTIPVSATAVKWTHFNSIGIPENEVFRPDLPNDAIHVKIGCICLVNLRFFGIWGTNDNLRFDLRVNGASNVITPFTTPGVQGDGPGDEKPIAISAERFIITTADVTAGGGEATLELYVDSTSGSFNVDQGKVGIQIQYVPLTKDLV